MLFLCSSVLAGCGGEPVSQDDEAQLVEQGNSATAALEQPVVRPATVQAALSELEGRRHRLASYWNKSWAESGGADGGGLAGFGSFKADASKRSIRRVIAGLYSLNKGGILPAAPGNFPSLVTDWSKTVSRYTYEGSPDLLDSVFEEDDDPKGDYDMVEREIISLLYLFRDRPDLLSNEAAFNLVAKGLFFWRGDWTTHAMQFEVGPYWYSETENHVLMTLSMQYLANQWIHKNYRNDQRWRDLNIINSYLGTREHDGSFIPRITTLDHFKPSQKLEDLLLAVIGRIPHAGYFETNGRNYQVITLQSLMNLYAFADSPKVRVAAKNALDYSAAKFAFQSLDCKRFSPHRRHHDTTEKAGIWENDSALFYWGAMSGACAFPDGFKADSRSSDSDTNFYNSSDQSRGYGFLAALFTDESLLGNRRYRIPEPIHDFMLNKYNGFWARFQDRFTENHYRRHYNPRYFYEDGTPYLSGTFESAPELTFVTNDFMNVAGGNHNEYPLKSVNTRIYDLWARPSAVISAGHHLFNTSADGAAPVYAHTGNWGGVDDHRTLLNKDVLNMSSRGDEWWYGKNLGVYKNFTVGTEPNGPPQDPRFPLYQEGGRTEFPNEFETIKFRFQQAFAPGTERVAYYIVLGELLPQVGLDKTMYFWEIVPSNRFADLRAVKSMAMARNYGSAVMGPDGLLDIVLTNGEIVGVSDDDPDYPIRRVISRGQELQLNRFVYNKGSPKDNPLIEVFEVDRSLHFTGVRYAENPKSGVINIWNPFIGKGLTIDSADFKNPVSLESTGPTARADVVSEILVSSGNWGDWYTATCPIGQFATGYRLRVEPNQGSGDDTSLNAVQIECKSPTGGSPTWISAHDGFWGTWNGSASCPNANAAQIDNLLTSARLLVEPSQGSGDDTAANDANFKCSQGQELKAPGGRSFGSWSPYAACPANSAVCGIGARVEGRRGDGDDTAMNGLRLMCCSLPVAPSTKCNSPIEERWTEPLGAHSNSWIKTWGDPYVDTTNQRLVLSTDDIVDPPRSFTGSYHVSHELTLSGGTVFTPYLYVDETILPSIRRSGSDMQLGGCRYGHDWSDILPAGFAGQRAANVLTGKVTTYVKAQSKQIAMKVQAGGAVYRSGWTTMTWPETNVGIYRLVGENTGQVYQGANDEVYVGPLSGCSALADADVDALYNQ